MHHKDTKDTKFILENCKNKLYVLCVFVVHKIKNYEINESLF
jgi:hypothetical protein